MGEEARVIEQLSRLLERSYAPYSGVRVAAVAVTRDWKMYGGVNVENSSLGLSVCAERVAIFNAVTNGERMLWRVYVTSNLPSPITPCGACLQVMAEFGVEEVVVVYGGSVVAVYKLNELLPVQFRLQGPSKPQTGQT